jgi:ABC-type branched-subunit amino acid transport system ATPase component
MLVLSNGVNQTGPGLNVSSRPCLIQGKNISIIGISYVPKAGRPFREMTVRENLEMGAYVYGAWKQKDDAEPGL